MASTLGMAIGPWTGGWLYDADGSYLWLYIGSFGIGLGAVAIALTFRPPGELSLALPGPTIPQRTVARAGATSQLVARGNWLIAVLRARARA